MTNLARFDTMRASAHEAPLSGGGGGQYRRLVPCRGHVTELQTRSATGRSLIVEASFAFE